ncbi:apoptosis facilitator Bcl-2-like protein 14 [Chlamydotis macqueenii]
MSSPNYVGMEEILLEEERDSIEYKILMAYAQRRLSVSKYGRLLKNEANVQKSSSLIRRKVEIDHKWDQDGPSSIPVVQGVVVQRQGQKQSKREYLSGYLPFLSSRAKQEKAPTPSLHKDHTARFLICEEQSERFREGNSQHRTSETADVNHIADKLAKLVTSRSQKSPSHMPFEIVYQGLCLKQGDSDSTYRSEGREHDEEKTIQTIVSLLRQSGDKLEEKIKKDRAFYRRITDMLSYPFFERITDLFLEDVSAGSTSEPGSQVQCMKVAFTMEVATRLTAVDNHPMNLVLGFGLKYLREHFKPWIQEQGGWEKALSSLADEEVE